MIELFRDKFYVYHHIHEGEVFYVGKGKNGRILTFENRNADWRDFVDLIPQWEAKIVAWFESEKSAYEFEKEEIARLEPKFNLSTRRVPVISQFCTKV